MIITRTSKQLVAEANNLAHKFCILMGYKQPKEFLFYNSQHPQALLYWQLACEAYSYIEGTDIELCLEEINEED